MDNKVVLSVESIVKKYKSGGSDVEALKGVSMSLYNGEMLAIMGSSGSGKSTLLNILGALDSPSNGKVFINGEEKENYYIEPYATDYRGDNIGFIFQGYNLLKDLSVYENVALPLILKGINKKEIEERVREIIKLVKLDKWEKHRSIHLSGGQQQRVAIARALITNPPVVLADEPTGNLDYSTSIEILNVIKEMQNKLNQSIIIVTHDPKVASYANRIIFLHDGKVVDEYINKDKKRSVDDIIYKFKKILED